jgi:DNA polymerase-3 subunit alpha
MIVSMKPFVTRKGQAMAFLEIEDRIMGAELVAFPTVWAKASAVARKGALVFVRAKVQQGDEDYKLLADDILPLDGPDLKAQAERLRRLAQGPRAGNGYGGRPASGAGTANGARQGGRGMKPAAPASAAENRPAASGQGEASKPSEEGGVPRVYILIDETHEKPATLIRLKLLLKAHAGLRQTVLRYEKERRTVALSDEYKVDPNPQLVEEIEKLLGAGTIRVK